MDSSKEAAATSTFAQRFRERYFRPRKADDPDVVAAYYKELHQNGAFDIDEHGGLSVGPYSLMNTELCKKYEELLIRLSELGLKKYNSRNNTNYRYLRFIKGICRLVSGAEYHITFEAKDESSDNPTTFQTLAYTHCSLEDVSVSFCRKKGDLILQEER